MPIYTGCRTWESSSTSVHDARRPVIPSPQSQGANLKLPRADDKIVRGKE